LMALTSFRAFPANCRCLFFICDVFFFGTAFSIPSHISEMIPGTLMVMAGMAMDAEREVGKDQAFSAVPNVAVFLCSRDR